MTSEYLRRLERMAVDLSRHAHGSDAAEKAAISFEQNRQFQVHDPEIAAAIEIAKRYEDKIGEKIKAYAAGWPQMVNWQTSGPGTAVTSFTTIASLLTQQPNIAANTTQVGTTFKIAANGVYSTGATPGTFTWSIGINGTSTVWSTAATAPGTSQTNTCWQILFNPIVITAGSGGTIQGNGNITNVTATAASNLMFPATQATALAWSTQAANFFQPCATNASTVSPSITVNSFFVLQLN